MAFGDPSPRVGRIPYRASRTNRCVSPGGPNHGAPGPSVAVKQEPMAAAQPVNTGAAGFRPTPPTDRRRRSPVHAGSLATRLCRSPGGPAFSAAAAEPPTR